ncbi:MAG: 1,2-phenylacetyl-CoA epoxidase subunit PaaC [Flavobacteriales bacterium]
MKTSVSELHPSHQFILALADDSLVLGQRLSEWCGHGPVLEEDIAMLNIALDCIGQSTLLFRELATRIGDGSDEDEWAFTRQETAYTNILLVELPNGDYARTIARQYFYNEFQALYLSSMANSSDTFMAGFATKSLKEVRYHLQHARDWFRRFAMGTEESRRRLIEAVEFLWPYLGEMFADETADKSAADSMVISLRSSFQKDWGHAVESLFAECSMSLPQSSFYQKGGRQGRHTEHMGFMLSEMQYLQRAFPGAKW